MRLSLKKVDKLYDKYIRGGFGSAVSRAIQQAAGDIGIEYVPSGNRKRSRKNGGYSSDEYKRALAKKRKDASVHAFANIESPRFVLPVPRNKSNEFPPNINFINSKIEFEKQYKKLNESNIEFVDKIFKVKQLITKEKESMAEEYTRASQKVEEHLEYLDSEILELSENMETDNVEYEKRDSPSFLELDVYKKKKDKTLKLQNRTNEEFTEYLRHLEELMNKWDAKFSGIMSLLIEDLHSL